MEAQVMTEKISIRCRICDSPLGSERELDTLICYECRRYGLLHGCWPDASQIPKPLESVTITHETIH